MEHGRLTFDLVDRWMERSLGGCQYHAMHPGGRSYSTVPVNAFEAESRRLARFVRMGHTQGRIAADSPTLDSEFPFTLDPRRLPLVGVHSSMFVFLFWVLLLQDTRIERLSEHPIDDTYALVLMRESSRETVTERVVLQARSDRSRYWNLEQFGTRDHHYIVVRADRNSVVLFRSDDYGFGDYIKLFFDSASKRVLKKIEFDKTDFSQVPTAESLRVLGIPAESLGELKTPLAPGLVPEGLLPPLPRSSYEEFARARPERARGGYTRDVANINEEVGAYMISGDRIWFGKTFYDGEGFTGVGDLGFFDRSTNRYTFLRLPQVSDYSVSHLIVEDNLLWASLVVHPEGADFSGGLLRYDATAETTKKYPVGDVISRLTRWRDGLYMMTSNGIYVLKGDRLTRYRIEPDISGRPAIYSEQVQ